MPPSRYFDIIIVGGGIAGLAAAVALRAPGRRITILEQSSLLSEIGATLSLQPNASRILQKEWGVDAVNEAQGMIDRGFRVFNTDGEMVRSIPFEGTAAWEGDRVVYHRQDLHSCLKNAALSEQRQGEPAIIRVSSRVVSCDCMSGSVTLKDGEILSADLIIGADGIHSEVRTSVLGKVVRPLATGFSAYRSIIPVETLEAKATRFVERLSPRDSFTTMIMAHDCRLIMGPARQGKIYSFVGLVPDESSNEPTDNGQSWRSKGELRKMLETFKDYPPWIREIFPLSEDLGLWKLRDLDPLETWTKGRVILVGDAAHAMLPTQGQGASQAIEDAEALGAFFKDLQDRPSLDATTRILEQFFRCRYERASVIQEYSRLAARPATTQGSKEITMNPDEFMAYNCDYKGAIEWSRRASGPRVSRTVLKHRE